jgi:hypothetical protein
MSLLQFNLCRVFLCFLGARVYAMLALFRAMHAVSAQLHCACTSSIDALQMAVLCAVHVFECQLAAPGNTHATTIY